ncbi:hypothetical protein U1Q18_021943 [Sarracenia purpurea var. burkii]
MASYKGKEVAGEDSPWKRKRGDGEYSGRRRKRKSRGALQFFDDAAYEVDEDEESDDSDSDDGFLEDEFKTQVKVKNEPGKSHQFPLLPKEEELSEEELEKIMEERYRPGSSFVTFAEDVYGSKRSSEGIAVTPSFKEPTVWKVKCMVGRERHSAFCLMQKYVDLHSLGTKLQIISAFALEHVKGFIYIEAERQVDINEACKGLCTIYSSRVAPVPKNEVTHLLSVRSKSNEVPVGTWARVKSGKYKGDLGQVVAVNDARKKATVKLIPRIDLQAMAEKFGGGIASKKTATPTPRLISSTELEEFRPLIQYRRDRDTGQAFEVLDGHQLKDGYLYKKVSIDSLSFWGVMPSEDELLKFEPSKKEESDCQEWLKQLFGDQEKKRIIKCDKGGGKGGKGGGKGEGSSSSGMASGFEVHDLVFFSRKDFGVIVGSEKDEYFKILKEGSEGPIVVSVEGRQLKNASFDKKFTALDHHMKPISINDIVRVLEGPLQDRQGMVKQIYRGIVFLYDENEQENSGYICCRSQICERVKLSDGACKGKGGESGPTGFEDFPSSPKSPLSPKKPWQAKENSSNFNRDDKDGLFSIGQSLRIRVGPLKGYLCRVLAVRRSDVTVKLDSQQKILTVKSEHLAEVRGKSSAISLGGDDAESGKPFDLLGTQDGSTDWMGGAGTSADGDRWGAGGMSTERSSWPAFPSSGGFSVSNPLNSVDNDASKDVGDGAWGSKPTTNQNSSWGNAGGDQAGSSNWKMSEEPFDKVKDSTENSMNSWNNATASKNPVDSWGKGKDGGNDKWGSSDGGTGSKAAWGGSVAEPKNQTTGWGSTVGNAAQSEDDTSGWKKATSVDGGQTESWGKSKKDGEISWGKSGETSASKGTGDESWGKAAGKWNSNDDSSGSKATWNRSASAPDSQTGAGGSSWNKQDGGSSWNKQGGGSSWSNQASGSWTKQSDANTEDGTFDGGRGSGGGRGRGRGGGRGGGGSSCYKCGETGHMARECSQGGGGGRGGGGGGNACFKCGETGHMARDCSQGGGGGRGGGGGGNACFKCGETGHMARDCSQGGGGGGRGGGGGGNACFKCGETGHMARECTQGGGGGGRGGGGTCFKCGETGHMARDCSQGGGGGGGGNACFKCGETGHMARDCSQGGGGGGGGGGWRYDGGGGDKTAEKWSSGDGSSGSKAAWGGSMAEPKSQTGGWGSSGGSVAETKSQAGGWGSAGGSVAGPKSQSGGWGSTGSSVAEPKSQSGGWGSASGSVAEPKSQAGGWGSGGGSVAEPKSQAGGWGSAGASVAEPKGQSGGWGSAGASVAEPKGQSGGWGSAGASVAEPKGQSGGWGSAGASVAEPKSQAGGWGSMGGSVAEPKSQSGGWGSTGGSVVEPKSQSGGWGSAGGNSSQSEPVSWGNSVDPQERSARKGTGEDSWGKGAEKWSSKDDSSGSKAVWNNSSSAAPQSQTGGWGNTGGSSWNKQDGGGSSNKQDGGSSWSNQAGGSSWADKNKQESWERSSTFDGGRGSGGGRGRGGTNGCFKCGETGHMARDCSQSGGGGGRGGGGGGNSCFKCGETGHMARDCSQGGGGGRSGGGGGNACYKCGETGHMARECSQGGGGGGGRFGSSAGGGGGCFKCGEQGHFARECPNASH